MANPQDNKPVLHTRKHIARLERERSQTRLILYSFIAVLVIVVGLIAYGFLDVNYLQARRPVAKVGNVDIPLGTWQARVRMERSRLVEQVTLYQRYSQYFGMDLSSQIQQFLSQLNDPVTVGQTVINQMVDEELIRQEARKRGITVSPQEVQDAIQASHQYFPNGTPTVTITPTGISFPTLSPDTLALVTLTPTPGAPTATLAPELTVSPTLSAAGTGTPAGTPAGTEPSSGTQAPTATATTAVTATSAASATPEATFTPLPTSTPYTKEGFDEVNKNATDKLIGMGLTETQIRDLYVTNLLREKLLDIITADVPHTQEQVWARHILVADEATAKTVRQRLANGEDFSKVAAEVSTDTGTKDKGGDLGWFGKGAMVAEFETAAFALKVGEISQPVKSQFGYHIIQALAHSDVPLDATAYDGARQTAFSDWLTKLRDEYKVEIYNNWQNLVPTDPAAPALAQ